MEMGTENTADLRFQAIERLKKKRNILGWGIGVAANAWDVYARKPITEAEIHQEEQRLRS